MGVLLLRFLYKSVIADGLELPFPAIAVWRARMQPLQQLGILHVPLQTALKDMIWPVARVFGLLLSVPYVLTRGVIPLFKLPAETTQQAFLWSYWVEVGLLLGCLLMKHALRGARRLHNSIRDERYLIGKQLQNLVHRAGAEA